MRRILFLFGSWNRVFLFWAAFACSGSLSLAQVNLAWTARFSGPSNVIDQAQAIAADTEGNVYITGGADRNGPTLGGDMVTVKYDPAGNLMWSARYGSPGTVADMGTAIKVDATGNVYVAGYSRGDLHAGGALDFVTIKYAPNGTQTWTARFSAPTNGKLASFDYPRALTVDGAGNVYVTGLTSDGFGSSGAYATVKYDANGQQLWFAIFESPLPGNHSGYGIVVNSAGEVWVTGTAGLVKYSASGSQIVFQPEFGFSITLDSQENVITAGASSREELPDDEGSDFQIIKYAPNGNRLWIATYDGAINESDSADHVRVDAADNIYVTGNSASYCYTVFDHDSGRDEERCDVVTVTLKLDPNGRQLWAARYQNSEQPFDFPVGLELDAAGNAYVAIAQGSFSRAATLKYSPNGTRVWAAIYNDPDHGWDPPTGLAVTANGDVHVGGFSYWRAGGSDDYFVLKYVSENAPGFPVIVTPPRDQAVARGSNITLRVEATGAEPLSYQWFHEGVAISGATSATLPIIGATFDDDGDYAVEVSNSEGTIASADARVIVWPAIEIEGGEQQVAVVGGSARFEFYVRGGFGVTALQWFFRDAEIPGATGSELILTNITLHQAGIYTLRASNGVGMATSPGARLIVSSVAEQCFKASSSSGVSTRFESAGVITTDSGGNVYVAGSRLGVIKYDAAGNTLWNTAFAGEVARIALDSSGNVYVTGFKTEDPNFDWLTAKYSPTGTLLWSRYYNGPANDDDRATGLAIDSADNVIVTGSASGSSRDGTVGVQQDYVTIKYSPNGDQLWLAVYDSPEHRQDFPYTVALDSADNIYVTGESPSLGNPSRDITTLKYNPSGTQVWVAQYRGGGRSIGRDMVVDPGGNVYVVGHTRDTELRSVAIALKYDSDGHQLWANTYSGLTHWSDRFLRAALDGSGNLIAAGGSSRGTTYYDDALLMKYDAAGNLLWRAQYKRGWYSPITALAVDSGGNSYALSWSQVHTRHTFSTLKFDANGNRLWEAQFLDELDAFPGGIALDASQNVCVVGGYGHLITLKYCQNRVPGSPAIIEPPHDQTVVAGSEAALSVTATGNDPLAYLWNIGTTGATLVITNAQQTTDYSVQVCNDLGCIVSPMGRLTVLPQLHSLSHSPSSFGFMLDGGNGMTCVVETSTDLQHWTPVATNVSTYSVSPFNWNCSPGETSRFFRARVVEP
jgi:uncharacterized delta-60 repeat protein